MIVGCGDRELASSCTATSTTKHKSLLPGHWIKACNKIRHRKNHRKGREKENDDFTVTFKITQFSDAGVGETRTNSAHKGCQGRNHLSKIERRFYNQNGTTESYDNTDKRHRFDFFAQNYVAEYNSKEWCHFIENCSIGEQNVVDCIKVSEYAYRACKGA